MQIYAAYHRPFYQKVPQNKTFLGLISLGALFFLLVVLLRVFRSPTVISPVSAFASASNKQATKKQTAKNPGELKLKIMEALDDSVPEYSIMVEDFLSPFQLVMGNSALYVGASVHKLPILAAIYGAVEKGTLSLDQAITFKEESRQDYGTGTLRYQKAGGKYSIEELATIMIKKSDNTAAYILANEVLNMRDIQSTINNFGLSETSMTDNMTSNKDMALLMKNLFTGRLFNASLTRNAINLLYDTDFEDRLPALLPNTARVYHKIGTAIAGLHDVGVVVTPHSMYYVGIFTRGVSDEERATQAIARASRAIYDFMEE